MDNSSDSINPSFWCRGFHRRWMILPPPTCLVILLCFSSISPSLLFFRISCCWCFELPFLPSSHLDIRSSAASEPGSYTPCLRCQLSHLWARCHWSLQAVLQGAGANSRCSWVKKENEIWLQVITLQIRMLHHTWFWSLTWHPLKLIISSRMNMITNFPEIGWKHQDDSHFFKNSSEVIPWRKERNPLLLLLLLLLLYFSLILSDILPNLNSVPSH